MKNFDEKISEYLNLIISKVPEIITAIIVLIIGRFLIKLLLKFINYRFEKREVDNTVRGFVSSLIKFILYTLLILTVASTIGIQTTSFIAALSAFGLAVGMALQGSLSNFAGGVLILLFRPFDVGDYISSANGSSGTVEIIDLLYTTLIDDEGIRIFSPNGTLANSVIKNYTRVANRRIQFTLLLSYNANIKVVRETVLSIINSHENVVKTPQPIVEVGDLKDGGIELLIKMWAPRQSFWTVKTEIAEQLHEKFDGKNVVFPQSVIKILKDED